MIYPDFLVPGDTVGITAPSAGISAEGLEGYLLSLRNLSARGFRVKETASVRREGVVSAPGPVRAEELRQLCEDPEVKLILCASGGDFLIDMLPFADLGALRAHPKWLQGYSDPTGLLFPATVLEDVATLYGPNAGGFGMETLHSSLEDNLSFWRGENPVQRSFPMYQAGPGFGGGTDGYRLDTPAAWNPVNGPADVTGRCLCGCLECLCDQVGTPWDGVAAFAEKYREDGIVWFFDVFALRAEQVYNALWHLQKAGWFRHAKAFLFGRVCFPGTMLDMSYEEAAVRALGREVPIITQADFGHVHPSMTLINGALVRVTASADGRGELRFRLA